MSQLEIGIWVEQGAIFDETRRYRYVLTRAWGRVGRRVIWLMLNPSTADERVLDPTVLKCVKFSQHWGFSGLHVLNLFGLRSTDPEELYRDPEPIGADNDGYIRSFCRDATVICAWGTHGEHLGRAKAVLEILRSVGADLHCLRVNKDGSPQHPLYIPFSQALDRYEP